MGYIQVVLIGSYRLFQAGGISKVTIGTPMKYCSNGIGAQKEQENWIAMLDC